jgi:hypothetical protein
MTTIRSIRGARALLVPIALLVAACSGSAASGSPAASGGTSAATATAAAPNPPASSAGTDASAAPSGGAIPSFDIGILTAGLANLDSYKVSITVGGSEVYGGTVVTKPVLSRDLMVSGGTRIVVIGNEAWVGQGGAPLTSVPEAMATGLFATYDPSLLVGAFSGAAWAQNSADMGAEQKNGIDSHHYHIDSSTVVGGFTGLPAGAVIDVWIADDGYLAAFESKGTTGGDISIEVTNVDDPANKVDRPS